MAYAAANGYTAYFPDALNPLRRLFLNEVYITERLSVGGVEQTRSIRRDAVSHMDSVSVGTFVTLTVADNSGETIVIRPSAADAQSVKAALEG